MDEYWKISMIFSISVMKNELNWFASIFLSLQGGNHISSFQKRNLFAILNTFLKLCLFSDSLFA